MRQLGTPLFDYSRDVAIDPTGAITIAGYTAGDLGGTGNAGSNDLFVARYSTDGQLVWVTQTGGAGDDQTWDLGVDDTGEVVVAVETTGDLGAPSAGGLDAGVVRYSNTGARLWARQFGTAADDFGHTVAVALDGTAYLVGYTTGMLAGTPSAGGLDMFVARFEVDGSRTWLRQRVSPVDDREQDVQLDPSGDIWISGSTTDALDGQTNRGGADVFAMRFDAAGTWRMTGQYGGTGDENSFGISAATTGEIYVECTTTAPFDGQGYFGGAYDFCVVALDRDGAHRWTRIVGTAGTDQASSCAVDRGLTGMVYVSLIVDGSIDGMPNRGGNDVGVAKLDATGLIR